ncbi:unnamed protein product [Closterium sp. NIES-53]
MSARYSKSPNEIPTPLPPLPFPTSPCSHPLTLLPTPPPPCAGPPPPCASPGPEPFVRRLKKSHLVHQPHTFPALQCPSPHPLLPSSLLTSLLPPTLPSSRAHLAQGLHLLVLRQGQSHCEHQPHTWPSSAPPHTPLYPSAPKPLPYSPPQPPTLRSASTSLCFARARASLAFTSSSRAFSDATTWGDREM